MPCPVVSGRLVHGVSSLPPMWKSPVRGGTITAQGVSPGYVSEKRRSPVGAAQGLGAGSVSPFQGSLSLGDVYPGLTPWAIVVPPFQG